MCGFANCPGKHACLLADVSPCIEHDRLKIMEELSAGSRRRSRMNLGFIEVPGDVANSDQAPVRETSLN